MTVLGCLRVRNRRQLPTRHNLTVPSCDADASVLPSDEKATLLTTSLCFLKICNTLPLLTSHSTIAPDACAETNIDPSGEKATLLIWLPGSNVRNKCPSLVRHTRTLPADEPAASISPSGENAKLCNPYIPSTFHLRNSVPSLTRQSTILASPPPGLDTNANIDPSGEKCTPASHWRSTPRS